jgi:hypothetical protein
MELIQDSSHFTFKICQLTLIECVYTLKTFKPNLYLKEILRHSLK